MSCHENLQVLDTKPLSDTWFANISHHHVSPQHLLLAEPSMEPQATELPKASGPKRTRKSGVWVPGEKLTPEVHVKRKVQLKD